MDSLKTSLLKYLLITFILSFPWLLLNIENWFMVIVISIASLKFLIYDGLVWLMDKKPQYFTTKPTSLIGYITAVLVDMYFVYGVLFCNHGMCGFAILGVFMFTPWILILALLVMSLMTFITNKRNGR